MSDTKIKNIRYIISLSTFLLGSAALSLPVFNYNTYAHELRVDPAVTSFSLEGEQVTQPTFAQPIRVSGTAEAFRNIKNSATIPDFEVDIFISDSFSNEQKEIIQEAARLMASRILTQRTLDCAYKYGTKNFALKRLRGEPGVTTSYQSDQEFILTMLYGPLFTDAYDWPNNKIGQIYISSFHGGYTSGKSFVAGQAFTNYLSAGSQVPTTKAPASYDYNFWINNFENKEYFFSAYDKWHKNHPSKYHASIELNTDAIGSSLAYNKKTAAALAGTIAHELLHNIGWEHTNNNPESYPETLIREYGLCVARDGADPPFKAASFLEADDDTTELTTEDVLHLAY